MFRPGHTSDLFLWSKLRMGLGADLRETLKAPADEKLLCSGWAGNGEIS